VQIIVIPHRLAKARTVTVSARHVFACAGVGLLLLISLTIGLYWVTLRFAAEIRIPLVQQLVLAAQKAETERAREFVQQNLNAMAVKLGEMQAQLARLDALGDRLSKVAAVKPHEFRMAQAPGLGGAAPTLMPPQNLSLSQFRDKLGEISQRVEGRTDLLGVLEAQLFEQAVKKKLLPSMMPVSARFNASGFGQRVDPFTGQWAMHEGIDFLADVGAPIIAAAAGVVVFAGFHPQYGYAVDIDHGNDLVTRYAHASKLLVKEGDVAQRGMKIAEVGSTGRSTGPHLHFEVRYKGVPQNPARFLLGSSPSAADAKAASGGPLGRAQK
jgi:murein DD-endopeptidase MepM/ murein hydrolase activator NlpD